MTFWGYFNDLLKKEKPAFSIPAPEPMPNPLVNPTIQTSLEMTKEEIEKPKVKIPKDFRCYAWCDCGDGMTCCDVDGSEAKNAFTEKKMKTNPHKTYYCFGCDAFYLLMKIKRKAN